MTLTLTLWTETASGTILDTCPGSLSRVVVPKVEFGFAFDGRCAPLSAGQFYLTVQMLPTGDESDSINAITGGAGCFRAQKAPAP